MKIKLLLLAAVVLMTISAKDAAAGLDFYALANPWVNPGGYDPYSTTSGTVEYTVYHEPLSNERLSYFELKFDPLFASFNLTGAKINGNSISTSFFDKLVDAISLDGWESTNSGFPGLPVGSVLTLTVDYILTAPAADPNLWPDGDGHIWAQSFYGESENFNPAYRLSDSHNRGHYDYGSTGMAPEPGTLMLLGSGLMSLGLTRRFRQRRKSTM